MLTRLYILHYALIERLDIDFTEGFSVITGETGAGKSIMLGALGLLLGGRADAKAIQQGATKCCVEATFDVSRLQLDALMEEADIDFDGRECIVRREVTAAGKSRAFVNDTPVQVAFLKRLGAQLIDIHSQHRNLLLGEENFLLETLDTVGDTAPLLAEYQQIFHAWKAAVSRLEHLRKQAAQGAADADYMQHRLQLLEEANLEDGEQENLEAEAEMLSHVEDIKTAFYQATMALNGEENSPITAARTAAHALESVSQVYNGTSELVERLESMRIEMEDIADEVERISESLEFDPARLQFVNDRLSTIYSLEKKFAVATVAELLSKMEELRTALNQIGNSDELIAELETETANRYQALLSAGEALTEARKAAAEYVSKHLCTTLASLGMPSATLSFAFSNRPHPEASGTASVTLLFSGNHKVAPQDVSQIASGGEIARLMLALKALIAGHKNLPTIVFDEIDTGVSGTMAERMAQVMQEMAAHCQVLCITHLPQIAALGNRHYRVHKAETEEGTTSHIDLLDNEARIREIANMLSGAQLTEAAINNARALLHLDE